MFTTPLAIIANVVSSVVTLKKMGLINAWIAMTKKLNKIFLDKQDAVFRNWISYAHDIAQKKRFFKKRLS